MFVVMYDDVPKGGFRVWGMFPTREQAEASPFPAGHNGRTVVWLADPELAGLYVETEPGVVRGPETGLADRV